MLITKMTARIHCRISGLNILIIFGPACLDDQAGQTMAAQPVGQAAASWTAADNQNVVFGGIDGRKAAYLGQYSRPLARDLPT